MRREGDVDVCWSSQSFVFMLEAEGEKGGKELRMDARVDSVSVGQGRLPR
jgi:hypothetical protein